MATSPTLSLVEGNPLAGGIIPHFVQWLTALERRGLMTKRRAQTAIWLLASYEAEDRIEVSTYAQRLYEELERYKQGHRRRLNIQQAIDVQHDRLIATILREWKRSDLAQVYLQSPETFIRLNPQFKRDPFPVWAHDHILEGGTL